MIAIYPPVVPPPMRAALGRPEARRALRPAPELSEAVAAEHAAQRASTKEQRTRVLEREQAAADYDDDDSFGWGDGGMD